MIEFGWCLLHKRLEPVMLTATRRAPACVSILSERRALANVRVLPKSEENKGRCITITE